MTDSSHGRGEVDLLALPAGHIDKYLKKRQTLSYVKGLSSGVAIICLLWVAVSFMAGAPLSIIQVAAASASIALVLQVYAAAIAFNTPISIILSSGSGRVEPARAVRSLPKKITILNYSSLIASLFAYYSFIQLSPIFLEAVLKSLKLHLILISQLNFVIVAVRAIPDILSAYEGSLREMAARGISYIPHRKYLDIDAFTRGIKKSIIFQFVATFITLTVLPEELFSVLPQIIPLYLHSFFTWINQMLGGILG